MDNIIRNVRDIDAVDWTALEHVLGQDLRDNQQIIVSVVNIGAAQKPLEPKQPNGAPPTSEIPEWWKIYEGLCDEEIDRLDEAIRQRANLTREFG